jgi:hypothetical protein
MSCGICNKWQHIPCHDSADLQAGRRKRNWDNEEFICQRCISRKSQKYDGSYQSRQYQAQSSGRLQQPHTERMTYTQPIANISAARAHPGYTGMQSYVSSTPSGQNRHDTLQAPTSTSMTQHRPYQPHSSITFAHYQPDPEGFSTRQTYQRDLPNNSQAFQRSQYVGRLSQQPQPEMATNLPPGQVCLVVVIHHLLALTRLGVHQSQSQYGNGAWSSAVAQPSYSPSSAGASFTTGLPRAQDLNSVYPAIPQWQSPHQTPDPRVQASNHYHQYEQHNSVVGSTSYQLP